MTTIDDQWTLAHLDQWAGLAHKQAMGPRGRIQLAPTWVPDEDRRRLAAYTILAAYRTNASRVLLDGDAEQVAGRREYGDPELLVKRVAGAVLGDSPQIEVEGATKPPPDEPTLPAPPEDLANGATPMERRIHAARRSRWTEDVVIAANEWDAAWEMWPALHAHQAALVAWADREQLQSKLTEVAQESVGLGDSVVELAISRRRDRPVVSVWDPGFYFPQLDTMVDGFPTVVHLAWESEDRDGTKWVHRKTYRLETLDVPRRYPWAPDVDSSVTCLMSEAKWQLGNLDSHKVPDLGDRGAVWATTEDGIEARDVDLGIDFIPIVHVPNTPADRAHWGESLLILLAQLLDDIQEIDSDIRTAAGLAAVPILAASGASRLPADFAVRPGATVSLGEGGRLDVLDMSSTLPALEAERDARLDRLAVNSRVSSEVMGRVDASDAASGFALLLSFGPFTQLIADLRLTRTFKHSLLLKFAGRMLQLCGAIEPGVLAPARLIPGSYLPSDLADVTARVVALVSAHAISRQTGLAMLTAAGMSIDDAKAELDRIRTEDTQGAKDVAEATGSDQLGAQWLGVDLPAQPGPPTVSLPPLHPETGKGTA